MQSNTSTAITGSIATNGRIAVIGGSGKSGKFLIQELTRQNIPFRILVRNPLALALPAAPVPPSAPAPASPQIATASAQLVPALGQVVQGDVRDAQAVLKFIEGCTAIISTLGQPKDGPPIFSQATSNILAAMQKTNLKRYIVTTGLNVDTPSDKKSPATQAGTNWMKQHYPATTTDKQKEYEILVASDTSWTLVRLPLIGLTEDNAPVLTSLEDCPGTGIHGIDLAQFLIRQLDDKEFLRRAPFLANRP